MGLNVVPVELFDPESEFPRYTERTLVILPMAVLEHFTNVLGENLCSVQILFGRIEFGAAAWQRASKITVIVLIDLDDFKVGFSSLRVVNKILPPVIALRYIQWRLGLRVGFIEVQTFVLSNDVEKTVRKLLRLNEARQLLRVRNDLLQ